MLKLFRLHVPELRFWKIKKKYEKIKTKIEEKYKKENRGVKPDRKMRPVFGYDKKLVRAAGSRTDKRRK